MKTKELMDTCIENGKAMLVPARELRELTKSSLTKLTEQQMAASKEYVKYGTRSMQALSAIGDPRALVHQQVALTKGLSDTMLDSARAYTKIVTETRNELVNWAEETSEAAVAKAGALVRKAA